MRWLRIIGLVVFAVIGVIALVGAVALAFQIGTVAWVVLGVVLGLIVLAVLLFLLREQMVRVATVLGGGTIRKALEVILWPFFFPARWLAKPRWLFVSIPEGFTVLIVEGGAFKRGEIQWEGRTLDRETWDVVPEGRKRRGKVLREPWHPFGGIRWLGFRQQVYAYRLRWSTPHEDGTIVSHNEVLAQVMLKEHIYYMVAKGVEDINEIPVDFGFLVSLSCVNPYKFVFEVQDPFELMTNLIAAEFGDYVGKKTWEKITEEREEAEEELWKILKDRRLLKRLKKRYGIEIKEKLQIRDITPPSDVQARARAEWEATQEAKAVGVRAGAEKGRIGTVYQIVQDFGDTGRLVRTLEALEKAPTGIFTVHAIPGLLPLVQRGLGRPLEEASLEEIGEEIRSLREAIEELTGKSPRGNTGSGGQNQRRGQSPSQSRRGYQQRKGK